MVDMDGLGNLELIWANVFRRHVAHLDIHQVSHSLV